MPGEPSHTTYTIIPRSGSYMIVATEEDGRRRLVAIRPTEEAAVSLLRRLQVKAQVALLLRPHNLWDGRG
jgi:hypothetical protein